MALTLLARPPVELLFGHRFSPAAPVLGVLAWTVPIALLSGHARWSLTAAGHQLRVFYAQIAGAGAIIGLGFPLVLLFAGLGAGIASVAGFGTTWIVAQTFAKRQGARLPTWRSALLTGSLAAIVIVGTHAFRIEGWSAGFGVAAAACARFVMAPSEATSGVRPGD